MVMQPLDSQKEIKHEINQSTNYNRNDTTPEGMRRDINAIMDKLDTLISSSENDRHDNKRSKTDRNGDQS
jgi:hypothetical protein